jgi:hypothetical protein
LCVVVHIFGPSYVGSHRQEDQGPDPGKNLRPYLKNKAKKG